MKITMCQNRFEVVVDILDHEEAEELVRQFKEWVVDKKLPSEEDFMAALGPCGK